MLYSLRTDYIFVKNDMYCGGKQLDYSLLDKKTKNSKICIFDIGVNYRIINNLYISGNIYRLDPIHHCYCKNIHQIKNSISRLNVRIKDEDINTNNSIIIDGDVFLSQLWGLGYNFELCSDIPKKIIRDKKLNKIFNDNIN